MVLGLLGRRLRSGREFHNIPGRNDHIFMKEQCHWNNFFTRAAVLERAQPLDLSLPSSWSNTRFILIPRGSSGCPHVARPSVPPRPPSRSIASWTFPAEGSDVHRLAQMRPISCVYAAGEATMASHRATICGLSILVTRLPVATRSAKLIVPRAQFVRDCSA
jgi:hypothetical protein